MKKRRVGKTQLEIDVLGLGGAPLGGNFADLDYAQGLEIVSSALDAGISYFDTAPWYGFGRSERVVGIGCEERITYCQGKWDVYWLQAQSTSRWILV